MTNPLSKWPDRYAHWVVAHRLVVFIVAVMACLLVTTVGLGRLNVDNNYRSFIGPDNEALKTSDWLSDRQGQGRESAILIYRPADRNVFSSVSLLQYIQVASQAKALPYVETAKSWLDTEKLIEFPPARGGSEPQRKAAPFLYGVDALSEDGQAVLRADILALPTIAGRYVGRDGATAAVMVSLNLDTGLGGRRDRIGELKSAVAALEQELRAVAPGDSLSITGSTLFDYSAHEILRQDLRQLFPLAFLGVVAVLYAIYRSVRFVALFMVLVVLPVMATAGAAGALGLEFSNLSISGLLLVGTLAVADVMHMSNSHFLKLGQGATMEQALRHAIGRNHWPVLATTVTTIIGQCALLFSDSPPIRVMGLIIIMGSLIALLVALTALPFALSLAGRPRTDTLQWLANGMARLSGRCYTHATPVFLVFAAILVFCALSIPRSALDDSLQGWFAEGTAFHDDLALLKNQYMGSDTITLALQTPPEDMIAVRRYSQSSNEVTLYADIMRQLKQAGGDGTWSSIVVMAEAVRARLATDTPSGLRAPAGETAETIAQIKDFSADTVARSSLMTRYEPGKTDYTLWQFNSANSSSFGLVNKANHLHETMLSSAQGRDARVGGIGLAIAQLSIANLKSIQWGSLLTFFMISATMFFVFRSVQLGILSMLPNVAPLVFAFGVWSYLSGHINLAAITVFAVALGIVVDDTIHLLMKYQHNLARGMIGAVAFEESVRESGVGVLATTVVIAGGFSILGFSGFLLTAQKAQLAALTIAAALVFDLFMLPSLLSLAGRFRLIATGTASSHDAP